MPAIPRTLKKPSQIKEILLLISVLLIIYLFFLLHHLQLGQPLPTLHTTPPPTSPLSLSPSHLLFSISSSSASLRHRIPYLRLWYNPNSTSCYLFLDRPVPDLPSSGTLPPTIISSDTSRFPYSFPSGQRAAIRIARMIKDVFTLNDVVVPSDTRWFVFGDDDTVFFTDNLIRVLSKYDYNEWYYIGSWSESYEQNEKYSFDMAFGGGGFAVSAPLARVLARVLDDCLMRYGHLYGSDARVFACLAELGVGLTREPGFHQVDLRGDLLGMLSAHPLSPLVSFHHMDAVDPIFPGMSRVEAMSHLFRAVRADPSRILQQTVCYDRSNYLTISVAWGYAAQVFEGNQLLPDLLSLQRTFRPWRRGKNRNSSHYMFNTRDIPSNPCKKPVFFFLSSISSDGDGIWTKYTKHNSGNCNRFGAIQELESIEIFSHKIDYDVDEVKTPRRQCCDILSPINETMRMSIRHCRGHELISMQS